MGKLDGVLGKIFKFNRDRGLLEKGFDYNREAGFLISESLELIDHKGLANRARLCGGNNMADNTHHDDVAKEIVYKFPNADESPLDKAVKFIDTWADQFVFGGGGGMKMGLPIGTLIQILHLVMDANLQKTGGTTEDGKQKKGTAFKSPDEQIREILITHFNNMLVHGTEVEKTLAVEMLKGEV